MNWYQLYIAATNNERHEITMLLLRRINTSQTHRIFLYIITLIVAFFFFIVTPFPHNDKKYAHWI